MSYTFTLTEPIYIKWFVDGQIVDKFDNLPEWSQSEYYPTADYDNIGDVVTNYVYYINTNFPKPKNISGFKGWKIKEFENVPARIYLSSLVANQQKIFTQSNYIEFEELTGSVFNLEDAKKATPTGWTVVFEPADLPEGPTIELSLQMGEF